MKRLVILSVLACAALSLVACSEEQPKSEPVKNQCAVTQGSQKTACKANQSELQQAINALE